MSRVLYFAYGSNMLTPRLRARCPSAVPVGVARADGFIVDFSKPGRDVSGKATIAAARATGHALGVVFGLDRRDLPALDRAEGAGVGYHRLTGFPVRLRGDGRPAETETYIATEPREGLRPFCWYLALVIAGAREHGLGGDYLARLRQVAFDIDPDGDRRERLIAVEAFRRAGHDDYRALLAPAWPEPLAERSRSSGA